MGESFQSVGRFVKKHRGGKNIVGDWGVDKSHEGGQKICRGVLSWGVLLRDVFCGSLSVIREELLVLSCLFHQLSLSYLFSSFNVTKP